MSPWEYGTSVTLDPWDQRLRGCLSRWILEIKGCFLWMLMVNHEYQIVVYLLCVTLDPWDQKRLRGFVCWMVFHCTPFGCTCREICQVWLTQKQLYWVWSQCVRNARSRFMRPAKNSFKWEHSAPVSLGFDVMDWVLTDRSDFYTTAVPTTASRRALVPIDNIWADPDPPE